jgi:hypothetical protein
MYYTMIKAAPCLDKTAMVKVGYKNRAWKDYIRLKTPESHEKFTKTRNGAQSVNEEAKSEF